MAILESNLLLRGNNYRVIEISSVSIVTRTYRTKEWVDFILGEHKPVYMMDDSLYNQGSGGYYMHPKV